MSNSNKILLPASRCACCEKSLKEIGGKRLTAQTIRGYTILDEPRIGGKNDPEYENIKINHNTPLYLCIWGEIWHPEAIKRAIDSINDGKIPWFCQVCGKRVCSICGYPINRPMGSDVLMEDGSDLHCGIMPFDPGCSNPKCKKYREW